jgi:hypothetical protein
LTILKNFTLRRGTIQLGTPPSTWVDLALLGQYFYLYGNGSFDIASPGILYLNAVNAPMAWHIYNGPTAPTLNNLTVQNSVDLKEDDNQVIIKGMYMHEDGIVALGTNDLIIDPGAIFVHMQGDYTADTGWLWLKSVNFDVGQSNFNIPNFRIHKIGADVTVVNNSSIYFTITKRLDLYQGDGYKFKHNGFMRVEDGVTVKYHSGMFDVKPDYRGTIRLLTVNSVNRKMPTTVWPPNLPDLVTHLEVLTRTNDPDRDEIAPAFGNDVNNLDYTRLTLTQDYQVNSALLLRNGILLIANGKTLTCAEGLDITRVDGGIDLGAGASLDHSAGGYTVTYKNNGNDDIFGATVPNDPPGDYVVAGPELPDFVEIPSPVNSDLKFITFFSSESGLACGKQILIYKNGRWEKYASQPPVAKSPGKEKTLCICYPTLASV